MTETPFKVGDRVRLEKVHHAMNHHLKSKLGQVAVIREVVPTTDGFEPIYKIYFDDEDSLLKVRHRYLLPKSSLAKDNWKVGDRCYTAAFGSSPCKVKGFNVNNADLERLGYDIVIQIDPDVAGWHGGFFPCQSKFVYRSPDEAIARAQNLGVSSVVHEQKSKAP